MAVGGLLRTIFEASPRGGVGVRLVFLIGRVCTGLGLMVSLAWLGPGLRAEEAWHDWSRVQALQPGLKVVVKSFKGMDPKVVGAYVSSDADSLIVRRENGLTVTIPKDRIRQVVRKRRIRHAVKIGAAAGFAIMAGLSLRESDLIQPAGNLIIGGVGAGLGTLGGFAFRAVWGNYTVYRVRESGP